ncbi:MAG: DUF3089 domain-containing protein [Saprospiraceae bacterium]|nr:DUF3089 domain-containing protein [Saprospiraceae bacterium]
MYLIDKKNQPYWLTLTLVAILLQSCASKKPTVGFDKNKIPAPPQYADLKYWAAHPDKKDPADLVPIGTDLKDEQATAEVDIFFLHPTTYTNQRGNDQWNGDVNSQKLNDKTDKGSIQYQASLFNGVGRVYAPRYRQAHYFSFFTTDKASAEQAFEVAYEDIRAAFEHYLKNWNAGRPIIIAAHSQGTKHAGRLLKEFFDDKPLKNRLVVAYIVGLPVPKNTFKTIPVCDNPNQTGCFCSWRTFKTGYEPKFPTSREIAVVNPLSMTTEETYVSDEKHKGGVLIGFKKTNERLTDAQIHNGILWVRKPKFKGSLLYRSSNYHAGDFNIFYINVREDTKRRVSLFWKR